MCLRRAARVVTVLLLMAGFASVCSSQTETRPLAAPPPSLDKAQIAEFLSTARIVGGRDIPTGVTHPVRLTLDDGRLRHDAAFSAVDERVPVWKGKNNTTELDFVDSYQYTPTVSRTSPVRSGARTSS
jgi:hypothetical protein